MINKCFQRKQEYNFPFFHIITPNGCPWFSAKKIVLNGYSFCSVSKNEKFYDFETPQLAYTICRQYNKYCRAVSKNKKFSTFESGWLYENHYKRKVSGKND
ncbi:MAG: hypothetical protein MRZ85_10050 [Clostridium sp.]|nr:hypothetical protein [Clostridium sp.]